MLQDDGVDLSKKAAGADTTLTEPNVRVEEEEE